jgi:trigger factor
MKKGETKDVNVTFGKDFFVEALRGKSGLIKVVLNKILQREIPELTDDFVKKLGKFENVSSFKDNIKNGILEEKKMKEEERIRLNILENIRKDIKIEVPEVLVNKEIERMIGEVKYKIANMGMEFEAYLKQIKKTEEDIKKDMYADAKQKVLNILILREIIDLEKISISEKEIQEKSQQIINDITYQNPNAKDIDMNTVNNYSEEILKNEKVFEILMNQ